MESCFPGILDPSSITIVEDYAKELLSLLNGATSSIGLGTEAEMLPGIVSTPDEHGFFGFPRDEGANRGNRMETVKPANSAESWRRLQEVKSG